MLTKALFDLVEAPMVSLTLQISRCGEGQMRVLLASRWKDEDGKFAHDPEVAALQGVLSRPILIEGTPDELDGDALIAHLRGLQAAQSDVRKRVADRIADLSAEAARVSAEQAEKRAQEKQAAKARKTTAKPAKVVPPTSKASKIAPAPDSPRTEAAEPAKDTRNGQQGGLFEDKTS